MMNQLKKIILTVLSSPRWTFGLVALGALVGVLFALYQQYFNHVLPCNMCIMQRVALMGMGVLAFFFMLINPKKWLLKIAALLVSVVGLFGVSVAARQFWLQHLPEDQVPACGPGLEDMLGMMPFWDVLAKVLKGDGDCAKVDWSLFGLSMPFWSGLFMLSMVIFIWVMVFYVSKKEGSLFKFG